MSFGPCHLIPSSRTPQIMMAEGHAPSLPVCPEHASTSPPPPGPSPPPPTRSLGVCLPLPICILIPLLPLTTLCYSFILFFFSLSLYLSLFLSFSHWFPPRIHDYRSLLSILSSIFHVSSLLIFSWVCRSFFVSRGDDGASDG